MARQGGSGSGARGAGGRGSSGGSGTGRGGGSSRGAASGGGRGGARGSGAGRPSAGGFSRGGSASGSGAARAGGGSTRGSAGRGGAPRAGAGASRAGGARTGPRPDRFGGSGGQGGQGGLGPSFSRAKGLDGMQVEGRVAVRELLAVGRRRVRTLMMAEGTDDSPILRDIERLAADVRVPIRWMPKEMILANARTEAPQGVIAMCDELDDVDADLLLDVGPIGSPQPFLLALDGLTDPGNLGALLRSAQGAGVTGVIVPQHRAVHITPTVAKAAAGAIEHLPIALVGGLPAYLLRAKERGAWVIGLDAGGDSTVYELAHLADQPLIVVVGAEGDGLSRLARERCDVIASIPLRSGLESLNASVAGAIALFEIGRHRPVIGPDL